ncbi:hypothetical protein JCM10908_002307 [Rhodotorula pacifica]|uniref:uncharacterized protein n=1 Tax=Rhodotorula pacifica TaxID=1495444 RepID=UPI00317F3F77
MNVNPEENLATFLQMAPLNLGPEPSLLSEYDFAYYPVDLANGESVSCVRWQGAYYMIGTDVTRTLAFRLTLRGVRLPELRVLKRNVNSRLRSIKKGHGMLLEPANSPLLTLLFQHDLVNTRKSQKLFSWFEVPHDQLLDLELARSRIQSSPAAALEDPTRRYACGIGSCKRRFTRLEHAQRHRTTHTQERAFSCEQCGKTFARKDNADAHVREQFLLPGAWLY